MRQFIGSVRDDTDRARPAARPRRRPRSATPGAALEAAELAMMERDDEQTQMRYAHALADWGDAGGYDAEVLWDTVHDRRARHAVRRRASTASCTRCPAASRSGWRWRRCCAARTRCCCSTSRTTTSTSRASAGSRQRLRETPKTVLFVSHDRELLANVADRIVTVEAHGAWVHGGGFATYHEARQARRERLGELRRRWDEEHERLSDLVRTLQQQAKISPDMASRYRAMQTRLREVRGGRPAAGAGRRAEGDDAAARRPHRRARGHLRAARADRADEAVRPRDLLRRAGRGARLQRRGQVALPAAARRRAGARTPATGELGARVVPGLFAQTHAQPELHGQTLVDLLCTAATRRGAASTAGGRWRAAPVRAARAGRPALRDAVAAGSRRGSRSCCSSCPARRCCCSTSRPTTSTCLRRGAGGRPGRPSTGTVLAVTHDRWFARGFDRFLVFGADGQVYEAPEPVWDEGAGRPCALRSRRPTGATGGPGGTCGWRRSADTPIGVRPSCTPTRSLLSDEEWAGADQPPAEAGDARAGVRRRRGRSAWLAASCATSGLPILFGVYVRPAAAWAGRCSRRSWTGWRRWAGARAAARWTCTWTTHRALPARTYASSGFALTGEIDARAAGSTARDLLAHEAR